MKIINSTFHLDKLEFKWIENGTKIQVVEDYKFEITVLNDTGQRTYYFNVPKGFISDGGSIPNSLYIIPGMHYLLGPRFGGNTLAGFIAHDFLYAINFKERLFCDLVMNWIHRNKSHVGWWRASAIYRGVRMGGGVAWEHHKRALAKYGYKKLIMHPKDIEV